MTTWNHFFPKNNSLQQKSGTWNSFTILLVISLKSLRGLSAKINKHWPICQKIRFFEKIELEVAFTYKT